MRILVANDDGVYSPASPRSLRWRPSSVKHVSWRRTSRCPPPDTRSPRRARFPYKRTPNKKVEAYRVNGTPADCVALGVSQWEKVDVVLSGINLGSNLGNAIWHSGTLAAAKQAALMGLRGIALSHTGAEGRAGFRGAQAVRARGAEGAAQGNVRCCST